MAHEVWVVRHGQRQDTVDPDWELTADRVHDPGLTELGRWQAWRVGQFFADHGIEFEAVYCSPFLRTVQTTAEIYGEIGQEAFLEPGLGEHRNAEWFDSEPETLSTERSSTISSPSRTTTSLLSSLAFPNPTRRPNSALAGRPDCLPTSTTVAFSWSATG